MGSFQESCTDPRLQTNLSNSKARLFRKTRQIITKVGRRIRLSVEVIKMTSMNTLAGQLDDI